MIKKLLEEKNLSLNNIGYKGHSIVIFTDKGKFVLKEKKNDLREIHNYLNVKKYHNYLPIINDYSDSFEIYPFIEEVSVSNSSKAMDMIYELSMLHIKTTTYEEINLDEVKKLYEDTNKRIEYLYKYYLDLQDYIEGNVYMAPSEYLLIRNISLVYRLLNFSKEKLDAWFKNREKLQKERYVLLNNNLKMEHFLEGEDNYFINWSKAKRGLVIYDFLNFFQNNYLELDMKSLYQLYRSKYPFSMSEENLFLALLAIPFEVDFKDSNYVNTLKVKNLVIYLNKVREFISEEDEENEEKDEQKFKEKDKSI